VADDVTRQNVVFIMAHVVVSMLSLAAILLTYLLIIQINSGWTCVDVASEIIKAIQKQLPDAEESALADKVKDNLRVCFLRCAQGTHYSDGSSKGVHSKHFIVDLYWVSEFVCLRFVRVGRGN
jgi:hypothetical protein